MEKTEKRTAEEIKLESDIWDTLRENSYSSAIKDHIDPIKRIVYQYAAQELDVYKKVIEELIPIAVAFQGEMWEKKRLPDNTQSVIERARKLIDKL